MSRSREREKRPTGAGEKRENVEKKQGYKETDVLSGVDPYSASKSSADIAIQSYFNSYFKNKKK